MATHRGHWGTHPVHGLAGGYHPRVRTTPGRFRYHGVRGYRSVYYPTLPVLYTSYLPLLAAGVTTGLVLGVAASAGGGGTVNNSTTATTNNTTVINQAPTDGTRTYQTVIPTTGQQVFVIETPDVKPEDVGIYEHDGRTVLVSTSGKTTLELINRMSEGSAYSSPTKVSSARGSELRPWFNLLRPDGNIFVDRRSRPIRVYKNMVNALPKDENRSRGSTIHMDITSEGVYVRYLPGTKNLESLKEHILSEAARIADAVDVAQNRSSPSSR